MILPSLASAPRDPCALEALARLPRAEAFDSLGAYLATDSVRDALCEQHRGRGYHDHLSFADRVGVRADALTRSPGSGHRAITPALERQILATQERAVYGKLARRPLSLAEAFRAGRTARLRPLFPAGLYRAARPASRTGLAVVVLDGNKIKRAAQRLRATRGRRGKWYGGKLRAGRTGSAARGRRAGRKR